MATLREAVETTLNEIDLLRAMYDSEFEIDEMTEEIIQKWRRYCEDESVTPPVKTIEMQMDLNIGTVSPTHLLSVYLEMSSPAVDAVTQGHLLKCRIRQPEWLTKAETAQLYQDIPDDIFAAIEHFQDAATAMLTNKSDAREQDVLEHDGPLVRVWFYFPSISTREKRDDIVRHAPGYGLTGFLLAGRPGVLALEGSAESIDQYMRYIKSVSWSDIPSQHKKVSEKWREVGINRAFSSMAEITDSLEKRGERSNRGDMKALEAWLAEKGLAAAFSQVLL